MTLPDCIKASRIGHPSFGSENEYDAFGEQAPITWTCNCGRRLALENFDEETEEYVATPEDRKAEFLAAHTSCIATCFKCRVVPVDRQGAWCDKCSAIEEDDYIVF